jgi:type VI secretion system protein ImpG
MNDELLKYYKEELVFFQQMATEFVNKHPKVSSRLGMSDKEITDPHLLQLVQAYALMNAKLRYKIEDDYPEVVNTLLTALHPHYQAPMPSMGMVQFIPDFTVLDTKMVIPKGQEVRLKDAQENFYSCMTCYETTVWPCVVQEARFTSQPAGLPKTSSAYPIKAVLNLTLVSPKNASFADGLSFKDLQPDKLRFFINAPKEQAYEMYEWLMCHTTSITLVSSSEDNEPVSIPLTQLKQIGFETREGLLPYPPQTPLRHRLLTEFVHLPEKFLFFELQGLARAFRKSRSIKNRFTLVFSFGCDNPLLERHVKTDWFQLGCTPIVNLFTQALEPLPLSSEKTEYLIKPGNASSKTEIYSIEQVQGNKGTETTHYFPLYGLRQGFKHKTLAGYFHMMRRPSWQGERYLSEGTDIFLQFVDANCDAIQEEGQALNIEVLCLHRSLPTDIQAEVYFPKKEKEIDAIRQLIPLTSCRWPKTTEHANWHILSHLKPNYLSIADEEDGAKAMQAILRLYDSEQSEETSWIKGVLSVSHQKVTDIQPQIPGSLAGNQLWHGVEITVTVDPDQFKETSLFLFSALLERFLAGYGSSTTFTQLIIASQNAQRLYEWQPRRGERPLL